MWIYTLRQARRVVIFIVGATIVLIGVALLVLPGPAMVVIPAGLAILAIEFAWARWLLRRTRDMMYSAWDRILRRSPPHHLPEPEGDQDQSAGSVGRPDGAV